MTTYAPAARTGRALTYATASALAAMLAGCTLAYVLIRWSLAPVPRSAEIAAIVCSAILGASVVSFVAFLFYAGRYLDDRARYHDERAEAVRSLNETVREATATLDRVYQEFSSLHAVSAERIAEPRR